MGNWSSDLLYLIWNRLGWGIMLWLGGLKANTSNCRIILILSRGLLLCMWGSVVWNGTASDRCSCVQINCYSILYLRTWTGVMVIGEPGGSRWNAFEEAASFRRCSNRSQAVQTWEASDQVFEPGCQMKMVVQKIQKMSLGLSKSFWKMGFIKGSALQADGRNYLQLA